MILSARNKVGSFNWPGVSSIFGNAEKWLRPGTYTNGIYSISSDKDIGPLLALLCVAGACIDHVRR